MAVKKSAKGGMKVESHPKRTSQGDGRNTHYSATSRNKARKKYRGQGR